MGLADFMVRGFPGTPAASMGAALGGNGGKTTQQAFIDDELPALLQEIHTNTDENKIPELGRKFLSAASKAGMSPDGVRNLMAMAIGPALEGVRQEGLNKLADQYKGQPAVPGESRPQGTEGPLTPSGNFVDPKAATPDKPLDLNFMMKFGQITGANPEQFNKMLETPSTMAGHQLSNQKTQQAIDVETAKQKSIGELSSTPAVEGQPSLQATARINPGGIQQFLPVREDQGKQDYQNQMLGLKQQGLDNALQLAGQRIGAANDRAGLAESRAGFNQAAELRKEFQAQSKNFQQIRDSYNRIQTSGQNPTPAGDLSMVFNYMKMLDPGSVVRESEFATAAAAKPLLERVGLSWDTVGSIWSGKKLTPGQRQDFLNRSNQLYSAESQQHGKRVDEYKRLATGANLNPNMVITDMEATGQAPAAPAGQGRYSEGQPSGSGSGGSTRQGQPSAGGAMDTLPPAKDHPGKIVRDTKTGERMKSDGTKWVAIP